MIITTTTIRLETVNLTVAENERRKKQNHPKNVIISFDLSSIFSHLLLFSIGCCISSLNVATKTTDFMVYQAHITHTHSQQHHIERKKRFICSNLLRSTWFRKKIRLFTSLAHHTEYEQLIGVHLTQLVIKHSESRFAIVIVHFRFENVVHTDAVDTKNYAFMISFGENINFVLDARCQCTSPKNSCVAYELLRFFRRTRKEKKIIVADSIES